MIKFNDKGEVIDKEVFELTLPETQAIVRELGATFIDRENPIANEVLSRMLTFLKQHEQLDK